MKSALIWSTFIACASAQIQTSDYSWDQVLDVSSAQQLTTPGTHRISIAPCPESIADTVKIYSSGESGETVPVIEKNCPAGDASGSITVLISKPLPVVRVGSATGGIQEAIDAAIMGGRIQVSPGNYEPTQPIVIRRSGITIDGVNTEAVKFFPQGFVGQSLFDFSTPATGNRIQNLTIVCSPTQTSGYAVRAYRQVQFQAVNVNMAYCPGAFDLISTVNSLIDECRITETRPRTGRTINVSGNDTFALEIRRLITDNGGVEPYSTLTVQAAGDVTVTDSHLINGGRCLLIEPGAGEVVASVSVVGKTFFDQCSEGGVIVQPKPRGVVVRVGLYGAWATGSDKYNGITLYGGEGRIEGFTCNACEVYDNAMAGIFADAPGARDIRIVNSVISHNSRSNPGRWHGAIFNASPFIFSGNRVGVADGFEASTQGYAIAVFAGADKPYIITNNDLTDNRLGGLFDEGAATKKMVSQNLQ